MTEHKPQCLCYQIIENAQDAIIFADNCGVIRIWNSGAESIFGYSSEEALGTSLDLIIPEKHRKRHWDGYKEVMKTGISSYSQKLLAVPSFRKDGERISVEFSIVIVRNPENEQLGAAAILRDVTVRWQQDRAMKILFTKLKIKTEDLYQLLDDAVKYVWTKISGPILRINQ